MLPISLSSRYPGISLYLEPFKFPFPAAIHPLRSSSNAMAFEITLTSCDLAMPSSENPEGATFLLLHSHFYFSNISHSFPIVFNSFIH